MKKVISILLIVMILMVSGCAKEKTPQEVYTEATEKMSGLTSSDVSAKMNFSMQIMGENITMVMDMDMKSINDTVNPQLEIVMNMEMPGLGTMAANMYYTDGYMYTESMGMKYKMAMPVEEAMGSTVSIPDVAVTVLGELTAEKTEEGTTILKFSADGETMSEYINQLMSMSSVEGMTTGLEYNFGDVTGSYTVNKEGYIVGMDMTVQMDMNMMGETLTADMQIQITYNDPGQEVEITFPLLTDYEDYTDQLG